MVCNMDVVQMGSGFRVFFWEWFVVRRVYTRISDYLRQLCGLSGWRCAIVFGSRNAGIDAGCWFDWVCNCIIGRTHRSWLFYDVFFLNCRLEFINTSKVEYKKKQIKNRETRDLPPCQSLRTQLPLWRVKCINGVCVRADSRVIDTKHIPHTLLAYPRRLPVQRPTPLSPGGSLAATLAIKCPI